MVVDEQALDDAQAFTGVVTVDVGDRRVLERCEGFVHRALGVPMTADARFGIASGSKAFTALAVMCLVEQGVLGLSDRVREWLGLPADSTSTVIDFTFVSPHGTPGLMAVTFDTPNGDVTI